MKTYYTAVPNFLYDAIRACDLKPLDKLVVFDIIRYTKGFKGAPFRRDIYGAWIKASALAQWHQVSPWTIRKSIAILKNRNIVICKRTSNYGSLLVVNEEFKTWKGWKEEWTARMYPPKKKKNKRVIFKYISEEKMQKKLEEMENDIA